MLSTMVRLVYAPTLVCAMLCTGCAGPNEDRWRLFNDDGIELFSKGDYVQALDSFDLALTLRPQDPVLLYNAAQCYDRLGDVRHAEQYYTSALGLDPKHGDAQLGLISLYYRTGRVKAGNDMIQDWLAREPQSADPYVADAWRLRYEKDLPAAQGRLQQALAIDPDSRRALTEHAILFETLNLPDRAYVLYERVLVREPKQVEIAQRLEQLKVKGVSRPLRDKTD